MAHPSTYTMKKNEILKLERRNKRYLKECELKMVSTMCKSTDEDEQQGVKINKDGYQTLFKAKVSEKIDTEGNFENDKLDMEFKECMDIKECMDTKECKDMEKVDYQENMVECFRLEVENEFQINDAYDENNKRNPEQKSNVNKTVYIANELCEDKYQGSYETQIYSTQPEKNKSAFNKPSLNVCFLSKKVQDFQNDRPSVIQTIHGASLPNPVDPHIYETKKSALRSTEAAIILRTAHETGISKFRLCKNKVPAYPTADSIFLVYSDSFEYLQDYKADGYRYSRSSGGHSVSVPSVHPNFRKRVNQRMIEGKMVDSKSYIFRYE